VEHLPGHAQVTLVVAVEGHGASRGTRRADDTSRQMQSIDPGQPIPLYFQLKTLLREEILSGRYGPGERLPTEHWLCAHYGISRTPVNRALSELAEEGVILRHRRRGTFVNPHWLSRQPHGRELRVVVPDGPWERQIRDAAPEGVDINVAAVSLVDLHQGLTRAVAEGRGPDLAVLDSVWVPEFAEAGFLWPLEELDRGWLETEYERDFLEPFVGAHRYEGRTLAVQAEADVAGLWYSRRDLDAVGLDPPTTWEGLVAVGRALARLDRGMRHPVALPGGSTAGETTSYFLLGLLASNGASVLGQEGVTLADRATVEALELLRRLVDEGLASSDVVVYEWDRPIRLLAQGQAAISFGGSYESRILGEAAGLSMEELWDRFGFASMPSGPRGGRATLAGGMVYCILRQAEQPNLAMRLLERVASRDALAAMARATGQIPPRRSAVALVAGDAPLLSATAEMLRHAVVRPATPAYPRLSAQLQALVEAVLTRRLEPVAASVRAADMIGAITGLRVVGGEVASAAGR
jgi:multiple sugar transport system substrate-binding protein